MNRLEVSQEQLGVHDVHSGEPNTKEPCQFRCHDCVDLNLNLEKKTRFSKLDFSPHDSDSFAIKTIEFFTNKIKFTF